MSTRGVYTFVDAHDKFHVYKHWDNYPDHPQGNEDIGAYAWIRQAKELAWELPRFEASEFATAFIARHKHEGGGVYLSKGARYHGDLSYHYTIRQKGDKLEVKCKDMYDPTNKIPTVLI